jgi:hypothetical protein
MARKMREWKDLVRVLLNLHLPQNDGMQRREMLSCLTMSRG